MVAVPGLGFAECGPGDLHMSYGVERVEGQHDPRVIEASERVRAACAANGVAFLGGGTADNITSQIDRGVRVVSSGREHVARIGRAHTGRTLPVG
jgi:4-hydroxy-2-oxoheptanedioate aldolase